MKTQNANNVKELKTKYIDLEDFIKKANRKIFEIDVALSRADFAGGNVERYKSVKDLMSSIR